MAELPCKALEFLLHSGSRNIYRSSTHDRLDRTKPRFFRAALLPHINSMFSGFQQIRFSLFRHAGKFPDCVLWIKICVTSLPNFKSRRGRQHNVDASQYHTNIFHNFFMPNNLDKWSLFLRSIMAKHSSSLGSATVLFISTGKFIVLYSVGREGFEKQLQATTWQVSFATPCNVHLAGTVV